MPDSSAKVFDVVVVGAGIVGLATARTILLRFPRLRLCVLDKEDRIAAHQTGHNSGVIHAGIYYKPGSLKAQLCVRGADLLREYADSSGIPREDCGKVIAATDDSEIPRLTTLWERGTANGVRGLSRLTPEQVREIEPNAGAVAGIHSAQTGIIDYGAVAVRMAADIRANGGEVVTSARVLVAKLSGGERILETTIGPIRFGALINCGGLYADRIARLLGARPDVQIVPFRGEYFTIRDDRKDIVRNLLYPVPHPSFPFLGVHFTRLISGGMKVGPNAVLAYAREGYRKGDIDFAELWEVLTYAGFRRLAAKHWRVGAGELLRSLSKSAYVKALQRLVPAVRLDDLDTRKSGVRAQCVASDGSLVDDFHLIAGDRMVHVLNVPSPAATACLAIAEHIVEMSRELFEG